MNGHSSVEGAFVNAFVVPDRVERSLFELRTKKKRRDFFSKIAHSYRYMFRPEVMAVVGSRVRSKTNLEATLAQLGAPRVCYVLSYIEAIDQQVVPLAQAISWLDEHGMPLIIVCGPELALFKAEQETGDADVVLLYKNLASEHRPRPFPWPAGSVGVLRWNDPDR